MAAEALATGVVIGNRFEVQQPLGVGGLGDLYAASDHKSGRMVALRIVATDIVRSEAALDQLRAFVKTASQLSHKNIVRVFGMGKEGAMRYIAMELVEGQSLRSLLDRKRKSGKTFSLKGAYNVIAHVCNALGHAHQVAGPSGAALVHGLPGPGTILINRAGRVKLGEFGAVCALPAGSHTVTSLGDAYALAPEMLEHPHAVTPAADIFTVGVVLYELLTGRAPGPSPEPMNRLVAGIPDAVEDVVWRCLQPDPAARFSSALELKSALYNASESASGASAEGIAATGAQAAQSAGAAHGRDGRAESPPARSAPAQPQGQQVNDRNPFQIQNPNPQPQPHHHAHGQPRQRAAAAAPAAAAAAAPKPREVRIEDLLAETDGDTEERWLIQKDRLDFGPFTMGTLKRALHKGEFSGDDVMVDQETGDRMAVRRHPALQEFMRHLDRHMAQQKAQQVEAEQRQQARKSRSVMLIVLVIGVTVLAGGGVIAAYMLTREPEVREKIVYREKKLAPGIKGINVQWKAEPEDQKKKRRALSRRKRRHRKRGGGGGGNVTRLGDASKAGGDELLSQTVVQKVMQRNFKKITPCVIAESRRNASLSSVLIAFGVRGTGKVGAVAVNGRTSGPFHSCVARRMHRITFPKFDGSLTRASFSMSLQR